MPIVPSPGDRVQGALHRYTLLKLLNKGACANAFGATDERGEKIFLKAYTSPTTLKPWYDDYLRYEIELNARLGADPVLAQQSVRATDVFSATFEHEGRATRNPNLFQVFPFVSGNRNLGDLAADGWRGRPLRGGERLMVAAVFLAALARLHAAKIVHADLKPANVQMVRIGDGAAPLFRPLLVDMDFSVLADRRAPWHGDASVGYVGTPGYFSPEHLRGEVPRKASDVFTAAVILCELLAGRHPFLSAFEGETDELKRRMREGETDFGDAAIPLLGPCGAELPALLRLALSPDPEERPTAGQLSKNLARLRRSLAGGGSPRFGWFFEPGAVPGVEAGRVEPETATAVAVAPVRTAADVTAAEPVREEAPPPRPSKLVLRGKIGAIRTRTALAPNRALLSRVIGDDARFTDGRPQFEVIPAGGGWIVRPTSPLNPTFLNGSPLRAPAALKDGDVLSIQSVYARISVSFAA